MFSEHWGYQVNCINTNYATINCPTIHENKVYGFKEMRAIYREFIELEKTLKALGFVGWVSWTKLVNTHIIKMFTKLKSYPYGIDVKKETIWFRKEL